MTASWREPAGLPTGLTSGLIPAASTDDRISVAVSLDGGPVRDVSKDWASPATEPEERVRATRDVRVHGVGSYDLGTVHSAYIYTDREPPVEARVEQVSASPGGSTVSRWTFDLTYQGIGPGYSKWLAWDAFLPGLSLDTGENVWNMAPDTHSTLDPAIFILGSTWLGVPLVVHLRGEYRLVDENGSVTYANFEHWNPYWLVFSGSQRETQKVRWTQRDDRRWGDGQIGSTRRWGGPNRAL